MMKMVVVVMKDYDGCDGDDGASTKSCCGGDGDNDDDDDDDDGNKCPYCLYSGVFGIKNY